MALGSSRGLGGRTRRLVPRRAVQQRRLRRRERLRPRGYLRIMSVMLTLLVAFVLFVIGATTDRRRATREDLIR